MSGRGNPSQTRARSVTKPHAFRPEMRDAVIDALLKGTTYRAAMAVAGIPWGTWLQWQRDVRDDVCNDPDVVGLVNAAHKAYADATSELTERVKLAGSKNWQAAAWLLDKRDGDPKARHDAKRARWEAEVAKNRAEGTHVETVRHVGEIADDELDRRIAELEAATKH